MAARRASSVEKEQSAADDLPGWPTHDGEMSALVRSYPWASTPLGPVACWSPQLKLATEACLSSSLPVAVCWGPELTAIYNDEAIPTLGAKHPQALGKPARENWFELWPVIGPLIKQVLSTGMSFKFRD